MNSKSLKPLFCAFLSVTLTGMTLAARAQEVTIPDPGLNAAIRKALAKPDGPLSQQDLLGLTNLSAISQNITNLQGLEAARHLSSLLLDDNQLTGHSFSNLLTNLTSLSVLALSGNPLANLTIPGGLTNLSWLFAQSSELTNLTLPAELPGLTEVLLGSNQLSSLTLPVDTTNLSILSLFGNQLTNLSLPADLTNLGDFNLEGNRLSALNLPANVSKLVVLIAGENQLTRFALPASATNLTFLRLNDNQLTNVTLPDGLNHLTFLLLAGNQLDGVILPAGMTHLSVLSLQNNQLTNLALPPDLNQVVQIDLSSNRLAGITLPPGLVGLNQLDLAGNQLTNLTLPPDLTNLTALKLDGNPLKTFVLSESLAATNLATLIASLQNSGVSVFTYPLTVKLLRPRPITGAFQFGMAGPPGVYAVLASTNLSDWSPVGSASNPLGAISFADTNAHLFPQRFYRLLHAPENMFFVPPNTFTMGSPTNEQDRGGDEGPQTLVTLTRGFWFGKFEVTQGEYFSIMNTNPSVFPGDLSRPVSNVSWMDATNYCWKLTQRELALGHLPPGSRYRLPTEAEWECAARAGTTTRFSYGDDPQYANVTNYMWELFSANLTVHPIGRKLPNPWGLYDMSGNVWEWCQDWYGPLPGGVQIDPTGPPGAVQLSEKVMRGGAYDYGANSCRSAARLFFPATEFHSDPDLGFRVVLLIGEV